MLTAGIGLGSARDYRPNSRTVFGRVVSGEKLSGYRQYDDDRGVPTNSARWQEIPRIPKRRPALPSVSFV